MSTGNKLLHTLSYINNETAAQPSSNSALIAVSSQSFTLPVKTRCAHVSKMYMHNKCMLKAYLESVAGMGRVFHCKFISFHI